MKSRAFLLSWTVLLVVLTVLHSRAQTNYEPYTFTTLAGAAEHGSADGLGSEGRFYNLAGVAVDTAGSIYVADTSNHTIRKVTPAGVVTTMAGLSGYIGSVDGIGSQARFNYPIGVAVDGTGNVYVADNQNHTIRKVTPTGQVTTLAGLAGSSGSTDDTGTSARFNYPNGVAVDSAGNVYVADYWNHTIRKITSAGVVTTLAGAAVSNGSADGTGSEARFNRPSDVAVDSLGSIYVADSYNNTIRKVTPTGEVTTLAGRIALSGSTDGTGNSARFAQPEGVAVDSSGNIYVADTFNNNIRKVTPAGTVTTLAGMAGFDDGGADGTGSAARFNRPQSVAVDSSGNVYVADTRNSTLRKVTSTGEVTTLAGLLGGPGGTDGTGSKARFNNPIGVAVDSSGNVYVADNRNNTIRKVTPAGVVTTLAGLAGYDGSMNGTGSAARFWRPRSVALDGSGNIYVADSWNNTIRKVTPAGEVTTLAGLARSTGSADGAGSVARFDNPSGVAVDSAGNLFVADYWNRTLRKITPAGEVTTFAGMARYNGSIDGTGSAARFSGPTGVAVDNVGNVYVADTDNNNIRKVTPGGIVTTLAGLAGSVGNVDGTGTTARFNSPSDVAVDSLGNVYVADYNNHTIRKITPTGLVTTLAGLAGSVSSEDGTGSTARFWWPTGVAVDSAGNVYVGEYNNTIRKGVPASVSTILPTLQVRRVNDQILLAWPASANAFVLETGNVFTTNSAWSPITTGVLTDSSGFNFTTSASQSSQLFRLRKP